MEEVNVVFVTSRSGKGKGNAISLGVSESSLLFVENVGPGADAGQDTTVWVTTVFPRCGSAVPSPLLASHRKWLPRGCWNPTSSHPTSAVNAIALEAQRVDPNSHPACTQGTYIFFKCVKIGVFFVPFPVFFLSCSSSFSSFSSSVHKRSIDDRESLTLEFRLN